MVKKKRSVKSSRKAKPAKSAAKKKMHRAAKPKKKRAQMPAAAHLAAGANPQEQDIRHEIEATSQEMFIQEGSLSFKGWMTRYSPVLITMIVGLATYFFLVFYLFYPQTLMYGHYIQLLMLLTFIFFVVGVLIYLGIQAELMFIRIMSFAFVFIIFTFLLIFILLANAMYG
ncbi:hypothetical protein KY363_02350 [Candidatus Woesearchaeota archaeon]|nr:hypothetical protein [Candidatus Woesearchaeota archaeon]